MRKTAIIILLMLWAMAAYAVGYGIGSAIRMIME